MKSLGKRLEEARIAKGWTPEAAAKATKIKVERLLEIERDDYSRFPAATYVRGFVRVYTRELGLDENALAQELDELCDHEDGETYVPVAPVEYVPQEMKYPRTVSARRIGTYIVVIVLLLICFVIAKKVYQVMDEKLLARISPQSIQQTNMPNISPGISADTTVVKKASAVKPEADAKPSLSAGIPVARAVPADGTGPVPTAAVEAPTTHKIKIKVVANCWVRISSVQGSDTKSLYDEDMQAGSETPVFSAAVFQVMANPANAVRVYYDDSKEATLSDKAGPDQITMPALKP